MAWSTLKTEAIVLTAWPFREADRRYRALTKDYGKIDFLGRGARKGKAKLAAHLEPFAVIDLEVVRGRRSTTVISAERIHSFPNISQTMEHRLLAQASLRLLDQTTHEYDADPTLYAQVKDWLLFLDQQEALPAGRGLFLLGGFLLRVMHTMGYGVALNECVNCKETIVPLAFRWHGGKGGLICTSCTRADSQEWFAARQLSEEVVTLLRFARDTDYAELLRPTLESEPMEQFSRVVHDLMLFHLPYYPQEPFWVAALSVKG